MKMQWETNLNIAFSSHDPTPDYPQANLNDTRNFYRDNGISITFALD